MKNHRRALLALAGLLVLLPSMAHAVLQVGENAPDFTLPDTAYVNHALSEMRGNVVVILFWASF